MTTPDPGLAPPASGALLPWKATDPQTDQLLAPTSKVVPFLGAGISQGAGMPDGGAICKQLYADFSVPPDPSTVPHQDPRALAGHIIRQGLGADSAVQATVAQLYRDASPHCLITDALKAIAAAPSGWVITLNYDDSVEQAARSLGLTPASYTWKDFLDGKQLGKVVPDGVVNVLHLHGCWQAADTIILDEDSYQRNVENSPRLTAFLHILFHHYNVCLLGTSFDEPYLVKFLATLPSNVPTVVFLCQRSDLNAIRNGPRLGLSTSVHHIVFEPYDDGKHAEVDRFCSHYLAPPPPSARAPLAVADFHLPPPAKLYVQPLLVARAKGEEQATASKAWRLEFGFDEPVSANDLALKARTLIVGGPGSGKTQLLRRAAIEVPTDERAVMVRLANASEAIGDPETLLLSWARASQTTDSERALCADDLRLQRFHFLLDGLDEVPTGRQPRVATRIVDIANAFPQHRFTVTTRPLPAADVFDAPEWERLDLVTTREWREEYLALAGVDAAALREAVPALEDLEELLQLPFFLAAVVDLYEAGALPAEGDLLGIIRALVDHALSAADIESVRKAVRPWLRDVALTMQLSGRVELDRSELDRIALPSELNLGPDDDVVDLLIRRSLLEQAGGRIRFAHRLVADSLVAEKLLELGPTTALLGLVAPDVGRLSGVRSDWLVVTALVAPCSREWRDAIRDRDELAAARLVPATAELAERRAAALTLWRTYVERRTWMHDYGTPRLLQDSEAIGRLLRSGDLPDVVDEVLGGIHHESPQVRSNAIEALAFAQLDSELEPVVRAALSGDAVAVVRRKAAYAADRRNLVTAYPLVKKLSLTTSDKLEAQDTVAVALRLAPTDELLDLALELLETGHGQHWAVETMVRERVGADAALTVMCKQARLGSMSRRAQQEMTALLAELADDAATTEKLAYLAAASKLDVSPMKSRLLGHPEATMRGIVAAVESGAAHSYEVAGLIDALPPELLDTVAFKDESLRQLLKDRAAYMLSARTATDSQTGPAVGEEEKTDEPEDAPPTLSELLARADDEADWLLCLNARHFADSVELLGGSDRRKLTRRIRSWWPEGGIAAAITVTETGNSIGWHAQACLSYGGRLKPALTAAQWTDVARASAWYPEKDEWLRTKYRRAGAVAAAKTWTDTDSETWERLANAIPGRLPLAVVKAISRNVATADAHIEPLFARLLAEGRHSALRALTHREGAVGDAASYYLAASGDFPAQRRSLTMLLGHLGKSKETIHGDDLGWMETITDPRLLPDLFTALVQSFSHHNRDGFNDTMVPIHAAIRRVGGHEAVVGYDKLMSSDPPPFDGVEFERQQRDSVVDDILRAAGDVQRDALAGELKLPLLPSPVAVSTASVEPRSRTRYVVGLSN